MAFTAEEKVQAGKFVNGMGELMQGVTKLGQVARTHGHLLRAQLYQLANICQATWFEGGHWFSDLSGTPRIGIVEDRERSVVLASAKLDYEKVMAQMNGAVNNANLNAVPQFADALVNIKAARDIFAGFDWTLAYANPRHEDVTPFDDNLTIVGPHGSWVRSVAGLQFVMSYLGLTWRDFLGIYKNVPVYVEASNGPLGDQLEAFANIADRVARVYSMHIEVETPQDAATIDADFAHDSGARLRSFHRAMLQIELLFNFRASEGKTHYGRDFERGGIRALELKTLERFFLPLAKANTPQWTYDMVVANVGAFGGPHASVTAKLSDFWQMYDSWAQSALGFYHVMPAPTIFQPKVPPVEEPPAVIPLGFFDEQASQIAAQQAELAGVDASLETLRVGIRALEGAEV